MKKDPGAKVDYQIDWSQWLGSDKITTSTWVASEGLTIEGSPPASHTDTTATIWVSGGTYNFTYRLTNTIMTEQGRINSRTVLIEIDYEES